MRWKPGFLLLGLALLGGAVLMFYWSVIKTTLNDGAKTAPTGPVVATQTEPTVTIVDVARGPKNAETAIVEFGDYLCSFCRSTQTAVDRLLTERPDRIRFVWKHAPSPLHAGAEQAAEASMCAERQGKFWEYHAKLFEQTGSLDQASLTLLAGQVGLDVAAFGDCLKGGETKPLVERTMAEAQALGLTGLPTIYVNGTRYDGAMTYEELLQAIDHP